MNTSLVTHPFGPLYNAHSRVLLLGSMPSPKSREQNFFYGHPQNRFWKVLSAVLDEPLPVTIEEKRALCLRRGVALWDVLASCEIAGASDASIKNPTANDFSPIFSQAKIRAVFTTGTAAGKLYRSLCEQKTGISAVILPSTSPANAAWTFERLVEAYRSILPYLYEGEDSSQSFSFSTV